jgi:23S rRNA pseudouridine2605 synthase
MRINKLIAATTGFSRRAADQVIAEGRVLVNGKSPENGQDILVTDKLELDGSPLDTTKAFDDRQLRTVIFNKPRGYVVSRNGQGSRTIYDLLPQDMQDLKPVGRLDKDSSGLLLLTDDGQLANQLTHPRYQKVKQYEIELDHTLAPLHRQMIEDIGVTLEDGPSRLQLERLHDGNDKSWRVTMREGRNRQIRRTFSALGYEVAKLHRTNFGDYHLSGLKPGSTKIL